MFKIIKIALASVLAIIFSDLLGLQYSTAAAIITLLTIQDTKRETISLSLKRVISFFIASIIAFLTFYFIGYNTMSFGVFLLFFVWCAYSFELKDTISTSAVIGTHYLLEGSFTLTLFFNEFLLLLIGVGIGTVINLFMPRNVKKIQKIQHKVEDDMQSILRMLAENILKISKKDYNHKSFEPLLEDIQLGITHAYTNMNNTFLQESKYFISYMEMRKQQCLVLENIYEQVGTLKIILPQTDEVVRLFLELARTLHHFDNAHDLLEVCKEFEDNFHNIPLPKNRSEFEACATLYMIMKDLFYFLEMKDTFANSLTSAQKEQYWNL